MRLLNIAILSFAILLRILVGFHPHSGQDDYQGPSHGAVDGGGGGDSSEGNPVKYGGDYEAQRHWMEITFHLPLSEWYHHDLEYWGLDYPPLTAYHSWVCGWVAHNVGSIHDGAFREGKTTNDGVCERNDSDCVDRVQKNRDTEGNAPSSRGLGVLKDLVALHSSRWGFEESGGKSYMRFTVLLFDSLVYMSAAWVLAARLAKDEEDVADESDFTTNQKDDSIIPISQRRRVWLLLSALSQPALILVDHGHFQYNTVSLGLALWSFHFMTMDAIDSSKLPFVNPILGSVLFSLALNFKQMELYHAPAIFAYLLGRCFRREKTGGRGAGPGVETVGKFCALGATVVLTFSILWLPFAMYPRGTKTPRFHLDGVAQIVKRLFPFNRGIFEGKVANIWCALSVKPFSIRDRVPNELLPLAALGLTLTLIMPPCWMLFMAGKDSSVSVSNGAEDGEKPPSTSSKKHKEKDCSDIRLLLWGTASTSLAFFLASFQVHEKGILIPLAPISLLAMDAPRFVLFFSVLATWSLWPLLAIDRLGDAYVCCLIIYLCVDAIAKVPPSTFPSHDEGMNIFLERYMTKYVPLLSWIVMISLHLSEWAIDPPHHLPDLFPVLWSLVGCVFFCISYLSTIWAMAMHTKSKTKVAKSERQKLRSKRAKSKTSTPPISLLGALLLSVLLLSNVETCEAFCACSPCHNHKTNERIAYTKSRLHSSGKHDIGDIITEELLERARLPLSWEVQRAREAKPVLDLSTRDSDALSLANGAGEFMSTAESREGSDDCVEGNDDWSWEDGHVWQETEQHLMTLGLLMDGKAPGAKLTPQKVLTEAPQLLRLHPTQIVEAATFLISYQNSTALVEMDPSLLTYWADDLQYGLEEYLPNMMFMGNRTLAAQMIKTQLAFSPAMAVQLVRMGVTGGLEERQVSRALGNAGLASGKAVEGVVGDMGRSYKEWKRIKGGKGSLG